LSVSSLTLKTFEIDSYDFIRVFSKAEYDKS